MKTILKILSLFLLTILYITSCEKDDDTTPDENNNTIPNFMVFTNQTGDPNANALQAQYIDVENNGIMNIYGTFNPDGTPKQMSNIRYKRNNNDSVVNVIIDELTGNPKMAIMEVNGQKENIVTEFGYTENENEIIISFHDHNFETGSSQLLYSSKFLQDEEGINENPIYVQKNSNSDLLWGVISIGGGIAIAELVGIIGGGFSLYSTALLPVVAALASVGVTVILLVGTVALLLSDIANGAELSPQDIPYPSDTSPTNPIDDNQIPNFPENPCLNSNLSVVIVLNPCNEIVAIASGGAVGPMSFNWSTGESIEADTFTSITVDTVGTYSVGIIDSAGCTAINAITVHELDESSDCEEDSSTDPRDGQVYPLVQIGDQTWMATNLNYATGNSWCYDNDPSNCDTYGRIYDWQTALTACPPGFHLPSDAEWTQLTDYLGGLSVAGGKMKSTTGWNAPNIGATNSSGFSGHPGGSRLENGDFLNIGDYGGWWSSSEDDADTDAAWDRNLVFSNGNVNRYINSKTYGLSCRCLRD